MTSQTALSLLRLAGGAALALGVLVAAPQAGRTADDRQKEQAEDACREVAQRRDWNDIETDVEEDDDDSVTVKVSGRRDGRNRERECTFTMDGDEVEFEDNE